MAKDRSKNTEGDAFDDDARAYGPSSNPDEDPQPEVLRPQEMPRAEGKKLPPRAREQALPEKDDDRFFDRWVVDKAKALGNRAVRPPGVAQLKQAVRGFAEWRSMRHAPEAEQQSLEDRALVAATEERIKNAEAEAAQLESSAEEAELEAARKAREAELADDKLTDLRPALRGSAWDFMLTLAANGVVFGVDIFVIRVALERIPSTPKEQWLTALLLGGGAVVVGDVLGWMAAAGSIRRDGTLRRPTRTTIAFVTIMLVLAVWFFGQLGDFREFGLEVTAKKDGTTLGSPTFFTTAQILFLLASSVVSFAYVGRRTGRELQLSRQTANEEREERQAEAKKLRERAKVERRLAAEAPALRAAAAKRIESREKIAEDRALRDIKQGEYLESLIDPEYMRERAGVESGIHFWQFEHSLRLSAPNQLGLAVAVALTLATGGVAYGLFHNWLTAVLSGVFVGAGFALALAGWGGKDEDAADRERERRYIAELTATARDSGESATDIERLVRDPVTSHTANGNGNGNGRNGGFSRWTRHEMEERMNRIRDILGEDPDDEVE